jgi:hypothetical protein
MSREELARNVDKILSEIKDEQGNDVSWLLEDEGFLCMVLYWNDLNKNLDYITLNNLIVGVLKDQDLLNSIIKRVELKKLGESYKENEGYTKDFEEASSMVEYEEIEKENNNE